MKVLAVLSRILMALIGVGLPFCGAHANTEIIEEVVVTAELRSVPVNDVAASVSLLIPDDNADVVNHLEEMLGRAVNVNIASGASRARFVQMRGVGERGQFAEPLNSSVGLLIDGVDFSGVGTAATLFDVSQIEILRGPQGTLYGANALAGLINVVTPTSTPDWQSRLQFDVGNYGSQGAGAVISGPLNESVGLRLSARKYRDNGFIDNTFLQSGRTDKHDESTLRVKLDGAGDALDWQLAAGVIDVANGYDAFSLDNNRETRSDEPGVDKQTSRYLSARFEINDLEWAQVVAAVGYAGSDVRYGYDEDWTFVGFHPYGYSSTDAYERSINTATVDMRWLSKDAGKDAVSWVFGVYLLDRDVDLARDYTWLEQRFTSQFALERSALYGELSLPMNGLWTLSVGARAEIHQADYEDNAGVKFRPEDDLFGSRLKIERRFPGQGLGYVSFSQGYKSGGFNTSGTLDADLRLFDPEALWNFEVGYKTNILADRGQVRLALFHMARADVQISTSIVRVRDDGSSEFIEFTGNAASGINQGIEAELDLAVSERVSVSAGLGLLKTEYQDYIDAAGNNLDGREQAHAPGYQAHLSVRYQLSERWFADLAAEAKDGYYFSDSHSAQADGYALLNAAVGYRAGRYSARVWGRNLADTEYPVRGFYFGNDPRNGYADSTWTQLGAPRQVGLSVTMSW